MSKYESLRLEVSALSACLTSFMQIVNERQRTLAERLEAIEHKDSITEFPLPINIAQVGDL